MSDDPAITADAAPEAAPAPDPTDAPAVAPETEVDPFAPVAEGEPAQFPREYVEKLRREGAKYRTSAKELEASLERLKPLDGVFDGYEPEAVDGWKQFIGAAQEDPEGALAYMVQAFGMDKDTAGAVIQQMFDAGDAPEATPAPAPAGDGDDPLDRPLTLRDLEAREQAHKAEAEQAAAVQEVKNEAKQLGYDPNATAGSPEEFRYQRLLHLAVNNGNDVTKAHDALVAEEKALVKSHMDALAQEADALPTPTGNGGPGAPATGAPDWKSTRERAQEFISAQLNA